MKKNLFEMGANFEDGWSADNKKPRDKSPAAFCTETLPPQKHQLHFAKEKRRGKTITIIKPFYLEKKALQALLKRLKKKLGTGGTLRENTLEFQGELADTLKAELTALGYRFKK
ncbi:MAG TPA: translation initiation factor [Epsilonproteobacteria bacterium]|nr:translation initiation factor [Campylobacterota bacterium]HHH37725.1 translation initiation factor [Campylobacterota bacterium]